MSGRKFWKRNGTGAPDVPAEGQMTGPHDLRKETRHGHQHPLVVMASSEHAEILFEFACGFRRHVFAIFKNLAMVAPKIQCLPGEVELDSPILPMFQ
jgi:hypothetical protein